MDILSVGIRTIAGFFLFCIAASAVYMINDILDIEKDKAHPEKRTRPIASGKVSVEHARNIALGLAIVAIGLSFLLNAYFGCIIASYIAFNFVYTRVLKATVIIDVFCIGIFFFLRIIAGSVLVGVELSHWMVFMTVLLALFLGFNKRRQEIELLEEEAVIHRPVLSKYDKYFIDQMIAVITSSIVVVYMLYTVDSRTIIEFGSNRLIYTIPFVYYGIFRYLYVIHRLKKGTDPTNILLSDRNTQLNLVLWSIVCILVIYFGV